jgi:hypothetical protein
MISFDRFFFDHIGIKFDFDVLAVDLALPLTRPCPPVP